MLPVKNILLQILAEASMKDISLGKMQLIKLLYLLEVEQYRASGERLTDVPWMFYHFGPYAHELEPVLAEPEFMQESKQTRDDRTFIQFKVADQDKAYRAVSDAKVSLLIKRIVGEWGSKSLQQLLDFVYFETEPMQHVERRGQLLDFTTINRERSSIVIPIKASAKTTEKVLELRAKMSGYFAAMGKRTGQQEPISQEYQAAIQSWAEEETEGTGNLHKIAIQINKPSDKGVKKGN